MNTKLLGRWGESLAASFLKNKGFSITALSYKCRFGEIDIIAENKKFIVFTEVKLRKNKDFGRASEFVCLEKQRKIISSAQIYLASNETHKQPRFDVIEIYAPDGLNTVNPVVNHIENAFGE